MKNLRRVASPRRPICRRPDLNSRGSCSCQHASEYRSNQGGHRRTSRVRTSFGSGTGSSAHARPGYLTLVGAEPRLQQKHTRTCLLALWRVMANRLCLVSTDTYVGADTRTDGLLVAPSVSPLMASTRMDGLIFKVLMVTSHSR